MANALHIGETMTIALKAAFTALFTIAAAGIALALPSSPTTAPDRPVSTTTVYEATPATTTTLPAYVNTCTQVATLALAEGLPPSELETALRVANRESRCTSDAFNAYDTNGGSYSIYQINGFWCRPNANWPTGWLQAKGIVETCSDLFDPTVNTRAMVAIWRNSGWLPWKTAN
jgi:hypothetical protein